LEACGATGNRKNPNENRVRETTEFDDLGGGKRRSGPPLSGDAIEKLSQSFFTGKFGCFL
jgi:hypothetical protein